MSNIYYSSFIKYFVGFHIHQTHAPGTINVLGCVFTDSYCCEIKMFQNSQTERWKVKRFAASVKPQTHYFCFCYNWMEYVFVAEMVWVLPKHLSLLVARSENCLAVCHPMRTNEVSVNVWLCCSVFRYCVSVLGACF